MLEEETVASTSEEEVVEEITEGEAEEVEEESIDDLKARLAKVEEEKENQKKRAEKAEQKAKKAPKPKEEQATKGMAQNDILYIARTDVHEDDVSELTDVMTKMEMTAKEAHEYLKPRFAIKTEERKTATVTQTGSPRGTKPTTGEDLLTKAEKTGEVPETKEGMEKMILAKQNRLKSKE